MKRIGLFIILQFTIFLTFGQTFTDFNDKTINGDAIAQFELGECYYNGTGITKDNIQAVNWYKKSAEQGNPTL